MSAFLNLTWLAGIDSVNILSFAVLAGLWLTGGGGGRPYFLKAIRYTGGAYLGIVTLAALITWVIGANQEFVRSLLDNLWVMAAVALVGVVVTVMGIRSPRQAVEEEVENPLMRRVLQKFGLLSTGVVLGVIQSITSVPYAGAMVLISFAETPVWLQVVQILYFGFVATLPSMALIIVLTRIQSGRVAAATAFIDSFLARGRALGRWLSLVVGLGLVVFAAVRAAQILGYL